MYRWLGSGLVLLLLVGIQTLDGQSPTSRGKGLGRQHPDGPGRKAIRGEPPVELGALTGEDAVAALSGELGDRVRAKGKNPDDYAALLSADASTWISSEGDLLFVDVIEQFDGNDLIGVMGLAADPGLYDPVAAGHAGVEYQSGLHPTNDHYVGVLEARLTDDYDGTDDYMSAYYQAERNEPWPTLAEAIARLEADGVAKFEH